MPFLAALLCIALFSVMDATMKHASIAIGAIAATFLRNVIGFVLYLPPYLNRRTRWPERRTVIIHIKRGLVGAATSTTFFYALVRLPLAEAIAISFIAPILALILAAVLLKERIGRQASLASLLGLAGVLVIAGARVGENGFPPEAGRGIVAVLISAVLYAWYLILQRQQAQVANPLEVVVFQNAVASIGLGLAAPWFFVLPEPNVWGSLTASAVLGGSALMLGSWAYRRAETQALVPLEYTAFLWASLIGWVAFGETVTLPTVAGAAMIISGCLIAAPKKHIEQTAV